MGLNRLRKQTRGLLLEALYEAQEGLCAHCGTAMYLPKRHQIIDNIMDYASIDHLWARRPEGSNPPGSDDITNKVAMHARCNSHKKSRPPNGCELIFHQLVLAKLEMVEAAAAIKNIPAARHAYTHGEPMKPTLGDIWPKMEGKAQ
jgi:hypothetical protein